MKAVTGRKYRSPFAASGTENRHIGTRSGGSVNNNPLRFKTEGIVRFFCLFRFSRGREPPKRARENVSESILQIRRIPAIIDLKNKNAAACGRVQHPQACTGAETTYTMAKRPHRIGYYTATRPFTQGAGFVVVFFMFVFA